MNESLKKQWIWRRVAINITSLHRAYLKIVKDNPIWVSWFTRRMKDWYSYEQIIEIWKIPARTKKKIILPKPKMVKMKKDSLKREKYWKDYFLNELKNERITD